VDWTVEELDVDHFIGFMTESLLDETCTEETTEILYEKNMTFYFNYSDQNDQSIIRFKIDSSDCDKRV